MRSTFKKRSYSKNISKFTFIIFLALFAYTYLFIIFSILKKQPTPESYRNILGVSSYTETYEESEEIQNDPIDEYIRTMSLEEKVGQMILGGVYSNNFLDQQLNFIQAHQLGGIILMGPSVIDPKTTLNTFLKIRSLEKDLKLPLFIAIDEEGGIVTRLKDQLSIQTPQYGIKNTIDAYNNGFNKGLELKALGINTNFTPVLDYAKNPNSFLYDRCFHSPKQQIAELGSMMIKGYKDAGILATPKHYPGHPDNITDSHFDIPISDVSEDEFDQYAQQFRLISINNTADLMMSGHILFPNIDPEIASLSHKFLTEILREEYKYEGTIITDDMNMGAITKRYTTEEAAVKAINAGNDILLYVTGPSIQKIAYNAVIAAVKNNEIPEEKINESVYRILKLKLEYLGWEQ